jgi:hypothetical protein
MRTVVEVGDVVVVTLPYSEVCMHMRVAGTRRPIRVLEDGAQILNEDGTPFSFPITQGEAGLFFDRADSVLYLSDSSQAEVSRCSS